MSVPDPRPTLEAPDDDPYLWLEDIESARVLNWVEAQDVSTIQAWQLTTRFSRPSLIARTIFRCRTVVAARTSIISPRRASSAHLHRPWRATPRQSTLR